MLRIGYCGNFRPEYQGVPFSTESHISATLENMGHDVVRLQEDVVSLQDVLDGCNDVDFFIWTRTPGFLRANGSEMLRILQSREIPTVSIHLDLYHGISRESTIGYDPFWKSDYVFSADGNPTSQEKFKSLGINHFWLKPGVYAPECYIAEPNRNKYPEDVIFCGSYMYHGEWLYRPQLIDWLSNTYKDKFRLHPEINFPSIRAHELNTLYASAKLAVGDTLCPGFTWENYVSDRIYEAGGRGAAQVFPRIKGITDEFTDGKNIILYNYGNFEELKEKIDYYLEHDEERESIRLAGHEYIKKNHTYNNRMDEMLSVLAYEYPHIMEKL